MESETIPRTTPVFNATLSVSNPLSERAPDKKILLLEILGGRIINPTMTIGKERSIESTFFMMVVFGTRSREIVDFF